MGGAHNEIHILETLVNPPERTRAMLTIKC